MTYGPYTAKTIDEVFSDLGSSTRGLREFDARERLDTYGKNVIAAQTVTWQQILLRQFKSPFVYLLAFASVFSFASNAVADGSIILGFIIINAVLGFFQEYSSEKSLSMLKQFVTSSARVRRNGNEMMIDAADIVPGDVLIMSTGDIIPADVRFIKMTGIVVDESPLTGESAPVFKSIDVLQKQAVAVPDARNIGFAGTSIVEGMAEGIVLSTGARSFMGNVATLAIETHRQSEFEQGINRFSKLILKMITTILVLLFVIHVFLNGAARVGELLLFSIALAISVVPEALPVVTTIALSKGALALARNKVVVRRLSAVEDLGSIEVLCTDKTGTLTENKLAVAEVFATDKEKTLRYATLGSSLIGAKKRDANNAFDLALWQKLGEEERNALKDFHYISERPFDPELKTNSVLFREDGIQLLVVRGAPEELIVLSPDISEEEATQARAFVAQEGALGRRTIAVGYKECNVDRAHCADDEHDMKFLGVISFVDSLKPTAKEAVEKARVLGVDVKILTGDGPEVSQTVAREIGLLESEEKVITGEMFDAMSEEEKIRATESSHVFARLNPNQKYEIIKYLERNRAVGYLGDGINDAPALKLASVALVVQGASDIARESSDIVLLNQSLLVIVQGIEDGRKIFANIAKYLTITLVSNFGNFYSVAIASLLIPFLPMLPIQLLLLNLLTDFPMIAIATDTVDSDELVKPRNYDTWSIVKVSIIFGLISTTFDLIMFLLFYHSGAGVLQTNWFIGSALTELALIYTLRTKLPFFRAKRPGKSLMLLSGAGVLIAIVIPFLSLGGELFKFSRPTMSDVQVIFFVVLLYFVTTEIAKLIYEKMQKLYAGRGLRKV